MPKLTLKRIHANDPIHIQMLVFDPLTGKSATATGLFDTGNDHTAINKEIYYAVGLTDTERELPVSGVTGSSVGQTALVTIGIEFDDQHRVTIQNHEVVVLEGLSPPVLIGRDFLKSFDVTISRDGTFTLTH